MVTANANCLATCHIHQLRFISSVKILQTSAIYIFRAAAIPPIVSFEKDNQSPEFLVTALYLYIIIHLLPNLKYSMIIRHLPCDF